MRVFKVLLAFISGIIIIGCTKDVDFDQIDDASINSSYIFTLVNFNLTPPDFLDEYNHEITYFEETIVAPVTNDVEKYLEKIEFTIITENSFNSSFNLQIIFYDESGAQVYKFNPDVTIPANSAELSTLIEIPKEDLPKVYATKYFGFKLEMLSESDAAVSNENAKLIFKSSVELFFNFRKT